MARRLGSDYDSSKYISFIITNSVQWLRSDLGNFCFDGLNPKVYSVLDPIQNRKERKQACSEQFNITIKTFCAVCFGPQFLWFRFRKVVIDPAGPPSFMINYNPDLFWFPYCRNILPYITICAFIYFSYACQWVWYAVNCYHYSDILYCLSLGEGY